MNKQETKSKNYNIIKILRTIQDNNITNNNLNVSLKF